MALAHGANKDIICSAKSIPRQTLRQILMHRGALRVPVFQRRYCWGPPQLAKLLTDIITLTTLPHDTPPEQIPFNAHSLGRMVAADQPDGNGYMVVDGQQRLTTVCILLSAVRDYFLHQQGTNPVPVVQLAQSLLFPAGLEAGCVVTPTYFDRDAFNCCVLGTATSTTSDTYRITKNITSGGGVDHVSETRAYFDSLLPRLWSRIASKLGMKKTKDGANTTALEAVCAMSLVQACVDKCTMLFFLMNEQGEEVLAAYSRLAMRDAMLSFQLNNGAPGVKLQFVDLCRNLVCCQFPGSEEEKIAGYHRYWAPVEALAMERAAVGGGGSSGRGGSSSSSRSNAAESADAMVVELDSLLQAFVQSNNAASLCDDVMGPPTAGLLSQKRTPVMPSWSDPGQYQFPIYSQLQDALARAVNRGQPVEIFLSALLAFAETNWSTSTVDSSTGAKSRESVDVANVVDVVCTCLARHGTLCVECIVAKNGRQPQPATTEWTTTVRKSGIRRKK